MKFQKMLILQKPLQSCLKTLLDTSCHMNRRNLSLQVPLLAHSKINSFSRGLNPWDEKIEVEGTGKPMHWPSYNER